MKPSFTPSLLKIIRYLLRVPNATLAINLGDMAIYLFQDFRDNYQHEDLLRLSRPTQIYQNLLKPFKIYNNLNCPTEDIAKTLTKMNQN